MGYIGSLNAAPVVVDGLSRLEYRGHDSTGIAVLNDSGLWVEKKEGRLQNLEACLNECPTAHIGIGHTRGATHGVPSDENAHPHLDCRGEIAVVHNGIIENYARLRQALIGRGHVFRSQTDTEVVAHLIEEHYQGNLVAAVREAVRQLEGSYALAVICRQEPDKIVAVRKDSPLIVGLGEGDCFLASDIPAILGRTNRVYILDDGEMAVLDKDGTTILDVGGNRIDKNVFTVTWDMIAADKGGYPHFMIKEIHEQPQALRETLRGRIADGRVDFGDEALDSLLAGAEKLFIVACGTAYHAGMIGKQVIEKLARVPVEVDIASEFRYREVLWPDKSVLLIISQSGETADTLAALRAAKKRGISTIAVTNVVGSSVARESDHVLFTQAGPEIAVASTKAYSTQVLLMYLIALRMAALRGLITPEAEREMAAELAAIPAAAEKVLKNEAALENIAGKYREASNAFFLGRGLDYAVALEGALKLKETSYIHAEAYAAGELKHGTLALVESGVPIVALATQEHLEDKMMSNIKEVKARGAVVIGISQETMKETAEECDELVLIPPVNRLFAPLLSVVPLQLLAYHMAVARGCDVDKPRNLAKSVTVE